MSSSLEYRVRSFSMAVNTVGHSSSSSSLGLELTIASTSQEGRSRLSSIYIGLDVCLITWPCPQAHSPLQYKDQLNPQSHTLEQVTIQAMPYYLFQIQSQTCRRQRASSTRLGQHCCRGSVHGV